MTFGSVQFGPLESVGLALSSTSLGPLDVLQSASGPDALCHLSGNYVSQHFAKIFLTYTRGTLSLTKFLSKKYFVPEKYFSQVCVPDIFRRCIEAGTFLSKMCLVPSKGMEGALLWLAWLKFGPGE